MPEHILFLTGKLAEKSLNKVLAGMQPTEFTYEVHQIGISVAGLMTADLIRRRLADARGSRRVIVPGRTRGDLDALSVHFGVPVVRGPDELKDIPQFFGRRGAAVDLSRHNVQIFAEIVDAPQLDIDGILAKAGCYRRSGADVIDLGCLPETPFPHLEDAVAALREAGFRVSIDSVDTGDLVRGGRAGADYLLSLTRETLWVADEVASVPVLIPAEPGDLGSLAAAIETLQARGKPFIADPILDPIHFGFTDSIVRYRDLRRRFPRIDMMMGVGNLTELTDADTSGINALLMGIISELGITSILATEVSPHARSAVREADAARRMMYAAKDANSLPRDFSSALLAVHERKPFPYTAEEIGEFARDVKDPSFRIQLSVGGIHVYNRDGMWVAANPFDLYPNLRLDADCSHAFYMGIELARAQIAWQLGKRYNQDQELTWGSATERVEDDKREYCAPGSTLKRDGKNVKGGDSE
jgi:dihydropteroate synthase-like protein